MANSKQLIHTINSDIKEKLENLNENNVLNILAAYENFPKEVSSDLL